MRVKGGTAKVHQSIISFHENNQHIKTTSFTAWDGLKQICSSIEEAETSLFYDSDELKNIIRFC